MGTLKNPVGYTGLLRRAAGARLHRGAREVITDLLRGPKLKSSGVASDRTIRTFEHQNSDRNSVTIQESLSEFIRNSEI